jgi:hypothetical protein
MRCMYQSIAYKCCCQLVVDNNQRHNECRRREPTEVKLWRKEKERGDGVKERAGEGMKAKRCGLAIHPVTPGVP